MVPGSSRWMVVCALIGLTLGGTGAVVTFVVDDHASVQLPSIPGAPGSPGTGPSTLPTDLPSLPGLPSGLPLPTAPRSFSDRPGR
ncbi:MAG TPA: hypothetical protein VHC49_13220 [Mycobacteriales bacterium]|nr:hypothetical protein [Mycobacteriales bacterium]